MVGLLLFKCSKRNISKILPCQENGTKEWIGEKRKEVGEVEEIRKNGRIRSVIGVTGMR